MSVSGSQCVFVGVKEKCWHVIHNTTVECRCQLLVLHQLYKRNSGAVSVLSGTFAACERAAVERLWFVTVAATSHNPVTFRSPKPDQPLLPKAVDSCLP
jgi:hypothetical protein